MILKARNRNQYQFSQPMQQQQVNWDKLLHSISIRKKSMIMDAQCIEIKHFAKIHNNIPGLYPSLQLWVWILQSIIIDVKIILIDLSIACMVQIIINFNPYVFFFCCCYTFSSYTLYNTIFHPGSIYFIILANYILLLYIVSSTLIFYFILQHWKFISSFFPLGLVLPFETEYCNLFLHWILK